jgi:hypothetical protein
MIVAPGATNYGVVGALPPGLTFAGNSISGIPTAAAEGAWSVTIQAWNILPDGTQQTATATLLIAISSVPGAPVLGRPLLLTGDAGFPITPYQVFALNNPTSYAAPGLPANLTINAVSGLITGTPLAAGTTEVPITCSNAHGTANGTLTVAISEQPGGAAITSALTAHGFVGSPFTYQITATNSPNGYAASGLPPDLIVDPASGAIGGIPQNAGVFSVEIDASNNAGTGKATLVITIDEGRPVLQPPFSVNGILGLPLTYTLQATGAVPITFQVVSGSPPPGVTFDGNATFSGTPTTTVGSPFTVNVTATNAYGVTNPPQAITFNIGPAQPAQFPFAGPRPVVVTVSALVNAPFIYSLTANGSPPFVFAAPDGLASVPELTLSGGVLSGMFTTTGSRGPIKLTVSNAGAYPPPDGGGTDEMLLIIDVGAVVSGADSDGDGFPDDLELFLGTNPLDYNSTPFNNQPALAESFHMPTAKLAVKLNFAKPNMDTITLSGTLPVPAGFSSPGQTMVVDVSGVLTKAVLNAKGSFTSADKRVSLKLQAKLKNIGQNAKYTIKLKGAFQTQLAHAGLANATVKKEPHTISIYLLLIEAQIMYHKDQSVLYTAKQNKSGSAK